MKKVISLYKKLGQTPLELLNTFKETNHEYARVKMAYAGRLDPMAHGLMLYLVGDECKNRDAYQDMEKTYEFDFILGVKTDTHDALGIIEESRIHDLSGRYKEAIQQRLNDFVGELEQAYPAFSSKPINGVPMYQLAKEGKLEGMNIPTKKVNIFSAHVLDSTEIAAEDLLNKIIKRIEKVTGDFRQEEIVKGWNNLLKNQNIFLPVFRIEISASSGTYMRSLADLVGEKLGTYAIAFDILRTDIGKYNLLSVENDEDYLGFDQGIFSNI